MRVVGRPATVSRPRNESDRRPLTLGETATTVERRRFLCSRARETRAHEEDERNRFDAILLSRFSSLFHSLSSLSSKPRDRRPRRRDAVYLRAKNLRFKAVNIRLDCSAVIMEGLENPGGDLRVDACTQINFQFSPFSLSLSSVKMDTRNTRRF